VADIFRVESSILIGHEAWLNASLLNTNGVEEVGVHREVESDGARMAAGWSFVCDVAEGKVVVVNEALLQ
jgi:hypothetical protein